MTSVDNLTEMEMIALEALRDNTEGFSETFGGAEWKTVYLDNAKPVNWPGKTWSGVLGSLGRKGLYREDDGYAFGLVRV